MIWSSNCWIRSSGEADAEEEVRSQGVEEEKFCWVWRAKLTILVVLRKIFLLADLLIAAEIWLTQCFIIFRTFDFLTSPSTNCNLSLICWRKRFSILTPISPVVEKIPGQKWIWNFSYCSILWYSLFLTRDDNDRLVRFIIGSGGSIEASYCYINNYLSTTIIRIS